METTSHGTNTLAPAYYKLKAMGYELIRTPSVGSATGERWTAESKGRQFVADEIRALLGLVAMYESPKPDAQAPDVA